MTDRLVRAIKQQVGEEWLHHMLYCINYYLTYGIQNHLHEDFFPFNCVENEMVTRTLSLKAKVSYSLSLGVASVNST